MDKRHERDELSPRPAAEGVRIIPADEAQAALDAGQAAGRRPEDAPRFGDVPAQPSGPRSPHRFPLPDSVDPASAVPRPPVRPGQRRATGRGAGGRLREPLGTPPAPRVVRLLAPTASPDPLPVGDMEETRSFPGPGASGSDTRIDGPARYDERHDERHDEPARYDGRYDEPAGHDDSASDAGTDHFAAPAAGDVAPPGAQASAAGTSGPGGGRHQASGGAHFASDDPSGGWAGDDTDDTVASGSAGSDPLWDPPREQTSSSDLAPPQEGITMAAGSGPELPHWTDPPTGEVPRILPDRDPVPGEELSAWQALGSRGLRWRDEASDWDDLEDVSHLAGQDETRLGALDTTRSEHSDMFSFDEQFERLEDERSGQHLAVERDYQAPVAAPAPRRVAGSRTGPIGRRPVRRTGGPSDRGSVGGGRDLPTAVVVGVGLLLALFIAYAVGAAALMLLCTVVVTASALELYNLIHQRGFKPATLLGLCATIAVMFAAYWRGEPALPLILVLVFMTSMLWYMLNVVDARPVVNVGLTVMAFVWVGMFGSFASLVLRQHHGKSILLLPILVTAVADVAAYFGGNALGSRPLAPATSPGKTWEGAIAGGVAAVLASVIVGQLFLSSTWSLGHALLLGLVIAVVAPLGDLCESMVKRDLDLKDSGTALPGHGGLLDRFDGLLFVLPATYYLVQYLKLH